MHMFCCWQLFRFCIECVGIEDVVEYFRLEIFYGFVVCVVAVGSVCVVVVLLFCILQVVLVDSRITYMCVVIIIMTVMQWLTNMPIRPLLLFCCDDMHLDRVLACSLN